ncbi:hypothetical protein, partial [uncultured Clostridium sp.]|uniref:hypothetical protein n=1 Tax=uncultured Clostridium sp. TaxID=59620 RepID=UPI0025F4CAC1
MRIQILHFTYNIVIKNIKLKNNIIHMHQLGFPINLEIIIPKDNSVRTGLMSIFWTQKVKLFYATLLANNSHCS